MAGRIAGSKSEKRCREERRDAKAQDHDRLPILQVEVFLVTDSVDGRRLATRIWMIKLPDGSACQPRMESGVSSPGLDFNNLKTVSYRAKLLPNRISK